MSKKKDKPAPLAVAGKEIDLDNVAASTKDALKEAQDERAEERGVATATVTEQGKTEDEASPIVHVGRKPSRNKENVSAFFEQAARKKKLKEGGE